MTIKHDSNKPRASLLPKGAVNAVIRVLEFGARKYAIDNWKTVPDAKTRYYDAMNRHIDAWWNGESKDQETGEHHLAHAICCGMFLWWFDDMDTKVLAGSGFAAKFIRKGDLPERGPIDQLGHIGGVPDAILEATKETCHHFSTTFFTDGKATCFDCGAIINGRREVLGASKYMILGGEK